MLAFIGHQIHQTEPVPSGDTVHDSDFILIFPHMEKELVNHVIVALDKTAHIIQKTVAQPSHVTLSVSSSAGIPFSRKQHCLRKQRIAGNQIHGQICAHKVESVYMVLQHPVF